MITCAEQLPIEIWLNIYQYFQIHHLFKAFQNLNSYFKKILDSNHLSFYVEFQEFDVNHICWSNSILSRVIYLQSVNQSELDYFPRLFYSIAKKFIRLRSLSIKIYPRDTQYICLALKQLKSLEYLSIKCIPTQILLESILAIPTLRICYLLFRKVVNNMNYFEGEKSNIKELFVIFYHNINDSIINLLLIHTSKLRRLEISGSYSKTDEVSLFSKELFLLPEVRILKLKIENGYFMLDSFKYLHKIMSSLKYFYFNYYNHFLHEAFIDYFISYWWTILTRIKQISIHIKGHSVIDPTQTILEKHRELLLAENKQSNGSVKVEWNEQNLTEFKVIEIIVLKS